MRLLSSFAALASLAAVAACNAQTAGAEGAAGAADAGTADAGAAECHDGETNYARCVWPADCPSTPTMHCADGRWQCPPAPTACWQSTGTFPCGGRSCTASEVCVADDESGRGEAGAVQYECVALPSGCAANPTCACVSGAISDTGTRTRCNGCDYPLNGGGTTVRCNGS